MKNAQCCQAAFANPLHRLRLRNHLLHRAANEGVETAATSTGESYSTRVSGGEAAVEAELSSACDRRSCSDGAKGNVKSRVLLCKVLGNVSFINALRNRTHARRGTDRRSPTRHTTYWRCCSSRPSCQCPACFLPAYFCSLFIYNRQAPGSVPHPNFRSIMETRDTSAIHPWRRIDMLSPPS